MTVLFIILIQSTSPSHSVSTNYQQVLSIMKQHSPLLCGAAAAVSGCRQAEGKKRYWQNKTSLHSLKVLLTGLEEELGALTL